MNDTYVRMYTCILRHTVVCQQPRNTPVCYLRDRSSSRFQPQKLWHLFLPNLHILMSSYTVPHIPNLKEIAPAVPEIQVPETRQIFFIFFSSSHQTIKVYGNYVCSCAPISTKFGAQVALPKPYLYLHKIWYDLQ